MSKYFTYFPTINYSGQTVVDITKRVKIRDDVLNDPYALLPYTVTEDDRPEDIAYYYYGDAGKVWLVYLANNIVDPYTQWPLSAENFAATMVKRYARTPIVFKPSITNLNITTNRLTLTAHGYKTTDPVIYSRVGGSNIGGLVNGTTYYVIYINANTMKLATTAANALAGVAIDLTSLGTGSKHQLVRDVNVFLESTLIRTNVKYYVNVTDPTIRISPDSYYLNTAIVAPDWTPVTFFQHHTDENENRRTIYLIATQYADQIEADLKKILNE